MVQLAAAGVMLVCLAASQVVTASLAASAGRNRLVYTDSAEEGDPPEVAVGIAMGAFRGLFVNMLWMRANDRKNEGRYYDAVDLARTITKLQPRFPRVWVFHAWNLAYNISVATNTPEERWNWVNQGIRLLREEGIPKNPNEMMLYKELAWLHLHKVQGVMDDANPYYKRKFAEEWTAVMGAPPRRTADSMDPAARVNQLDAMWLSPIAQAKDTLSDVIEAFPEAQKLVDRLKAEAGIDLSQAYFDDRGQGPGERLLRTYEIARAAALRDGRIRAELLPSDTNLKAIEIMSDREFDKARRSLVLHVRKRLLLDRYHMEPEQMVRCMRAFGPLDWRHAATHAIYWAWRGVDEALLRATRENRRDFDFLNTDRMLLHGIQEMYRTGELVFNIINPNFYLAMPCADFIPVYGKVIEENGPNSLKDRGGVFTKDSRPFRTYAAGYENFLKDAIRFLYRRGQKDEAEMYRQKLLTWTDQNYNDPARAEELSKPLDEFVFNEIVKDDRFAVPDVALSEIVAALQSAYTEGLLAGNQKLFTESLTYAAEFHKRFVERQIFNTSVNQGDKARMEFIIDRDFQVFAGSILATLAAYMAPDDGQVVYARAPDDLRAAAYVHLERSELNDGDQFQVRFPPPAKALIDEYVQRVAARDERRKAFAGTVEQK